VQEWMGHAGVQTTMRYLHYAPRRATTTRRSSAAHLGPSALAPRTSSPSSETDSLRGTDERPGSRW
jgi:hypothetical protein